MTKSLLDFSDKIDPISLEIYQVISDCLEDTQWYVIGAQARDLYLEHKYKIKNLRITRDFDLAIQVQNWNEYHELKSSLLKNDEFTSSKEAHRLFYKKEVPVDIVPFGELANYEHVVEWPREGSRMSVVGFKDVLQASETIIVSNKPDLEIRFATPAGLTVLKIIAWSDRPLERGKDIDDIYVIMTNYVYFDNWDRLNEEDKDLRETDEFNEIYASCQLLGRDIAKISSKETLDFLVSILEAEISKGIDSALLPELQKKASAEDSNEPMTLIEYLLKGLKD